MKNIVFLILIITTSSILSYSQTEKSNNYPLSIGPFISLKGGVNAAGVPKGIKNGFNFNGIPDFGASLYVPFTEQSKFGMTADFAYSTYTYELELYDYPYSKWSNEFSYFTISPNLHIFGFMFGFAIGIPLSSKTDNSNYSKYFHSSDLTTMFELRIGGMIPVYANETGRLNFIINSGYVINGIYKEKNINDFLNQMSTSGSFNAHPAWISFGLDYLFNLTSNNQ
jgi:hypothetical protein